MLSFIAKRFCFLIITMLVVSSLLFLIATTAAAAPASPPCEIRAFEQRGRYGYKDAQGTVLIEREEITYLKDGRSFSLPVMDSFETRDGKIVSFREYWDLSLLTQHLEGTATGDQATQAFEQYKDEVGPWSRYIGVLNR